MRAVTALVVGRTREDVAAVFQVPLKAVDNLVAEVAGRRARGVGLASCRSPCRFSSASKNFSAEVTSMSP